MVRVMESKYPDAKLDFPVEKEKLIQRILGWRFIFSSIDSVN